MEDLAERVVGTFQLTTDGLNLHPAAVEHALGGRVSYAQLVKQYAHEPEREGERRYSPAVCLGAEKIIVSGTPDPRHISTSHVERQNLTMRMSMRCFTPAHQRLLEEAGEPLGGRQPALRLLQLVPGSRHHPHHPAMAAGLTHRPWSVADLVGLLSRPANPES